MIKDGAYRAVKKLLANEEKKLALIALKTSECE